MPYSTRHELLKQRIEDLKIHLLPVYDSEGNYNPSQLYFIHAFRLLAHAELESYFEDIIKETVNDVMTIWHANKNKITQITFNLLATYRFTRKDMIQEPSQLIVQAHKRLLTEIDKNHGIKSDDLNSMFNAIGFSINEELLLNLDNYGSLRGKIAHNSYTTRISNPKSELDKIDKIIEGINNFDILFCEYKNNCLGNHLEIISIPHSRSSP